MSLELLLTILIFGVGLLLPWAIALWRRWQLRGEAGRPPVDSPWIVQSLLAYVVAFNLTFFIQELFLVLPKAMVPGLEPTLFHNNHNWEGDAPIADLFQGTGALAILVSGLLFAFVAARQARPSLFILWMAFHGLFQSLPQFVVGAITPANDVGQAYDYLALGAVGETVLAMFALAAMAIAGPWLGTRFLATANDGRQVETPRARFAYLLRIAGLPALAAIPLVVLFRVPREAIEVLAPPILVPLFGYGWLQLAAFRRAPAIASTHRAEPRIIATAIAATALLAFFQLVLRPGIAF